VQAVLIERQKAVLGDQPNPFAAPFAAPGAVPATPTLKIGTTPTLKIGTTPTLKIGTLYVNCGPVGMYVMDATVFIQAAKAKILETQGLADYRFAEFGHGPGMLAVATAALVEEYLTMRGSETPSRSRLEESAGIPALRLDTSTPEGSIVAVELMARSAMVVR
jgi:hypothetical protein